MLKNQVILFLSGIMQGQCYGNRTASQVIFEEGIFSSQDSTTCPNKIRDIHMIWCIYIILVG